MKFTHKDQIDFSRLALALYDKEKDHIEKLQQLLAVGEMIKAYADENNGVIFDITEYIYEHIRILQGDERAFEDTTQRERLEKDIRSYT